MAQNSGSNAVKLVICRTTSGSGLNDDVFSSGDEVAGEVALSTREEVRIEKVDISFVGCARTSVDSVVSSAPSVTEKHFLKLDQATETSTGNTLLSAGDSCSMPFNFVIPHQLLDSSCSCPSIPNDHFQVPPTMGGSQQWEHNAEALDDPTPDMAEIAYKIITKVLFRDRHGRSRLAESSHKVCVVPSFPEPPPLFSSRYRVRQEKVVRRSVLQGKVGCLVMEAQPTSALKGIAYNNGVLVSTKVLVRFDPASYECAPPALEDITRKMHATTTFRAGPAVASGSSGQPAFSTQRSYAEALSLPPFGLAGAQWLRRSPGWEHMQLSNGRVAPADIIAPSAGYVGAVYYILKMTIPVQLPAGKVLVPTFHSCLVSRTYELEIALSLASAGSLSVRIPMQTCT